MKSELEYWIDRCLIAEKRLELISYIPKSELNSLSTKRQMEVYDLKWKTSRLLKDHNIDKWNEICKEALLSNDQIYYWTLKLREGQILQEHFESKN